MEGNDLSILYPLLGRLVTYPSPGYREDLQQTEAAMREMEDDVRTSFGSFIRSVRDLTLEDLQELSTRTFDLSPTCVPYLSVHLFGEENLKRSRLMVALKERYLDWGFDPGRELPDHLGLVLRAAPHFAREEWQEFATHCLLPALEKMREALRETSNPFRHLIETLHTLLSAETLLNLEVSHG